MQAVPVRCPRCGRPVPAGVAYCPNCGEAADPALVAELQWLYRTLRDLDQRIAAGQGAPALTQLREEYLRQYQAKRAPAAAAVPEGVTAGAMPFPVAGGVLPPAPSANAPPAQPFSWNTFFAEQSITIFAYVGTFLLLVATIAFEVSPWTALTNGIKLGIVIGIYLLVGISAMLTGRADRLRVINRTYIAIFALMTPLVGLALYIYELRDLNLPVAGVVCITALYASAVYLLLTVRIKAPVYVFLGWGALVVAGQALIPWLNAPSEWMFTALVATTLIIVLSQLVIDMPEVLQQTALTALIASIVAILFGEELWIGALGVSSIRLATLVGIVGLMVLAIAWRILVARRSLVKSAGRLDAIEWAAVAFNAQAVLLAAVWVGATPAQAGYVLAVMAVAEALFAQSLRLWRPTQRALREGIEGLAVGLGFLGGLINFTHADPNWPMIAPIATALALALGIAVLERQRWWLVAASLALGMLAHSVASSILTLGVGLTPSVTYGNVSSYAIALARADAGIVLGIWALGLAISFTARRAAATPIFVGVLVGALFTLTEIFVSPNEAAFQTIALGLYTLAALLAGVRMRDTIYSAIATGIFGLLAVIPYGVSQNGWQSAGVGLAAVAFAIAVRAILGERWRYAPYAVAVLAVFIAETQLAQSGESTASLAFLAIPFAAWFDLGIAALSLVLAGIEQQPWTTAIPALLMLGAIAQTGDPNGLLAEMVALLAFAAIMRAWRGRWWNTAILVAAVIGALVATAAYANTGDSGAVQRTVLLGLIAIAGYAAILADQGYIETVILVSFLIFAPTFQFSVQIQPQWLYASLMVVEGVIMLIIGVGTRARLQQGIGATMLAIAAVRAAVLAYQTGVPVALIIGALALILLGFATFLSTRVRHPSPPSATV